MLIYKHTNLTNGKIYIGYTSKSINERWEGHINDAKKGSSLYFHKAILKSIIELGENFLNSWSSEVLVNNISSLEEAKELEKKFISEYNSNHRQFGYNMTKGGDGTTGHIFRPESIEKLSRAMKGKDRSEEHRRKISENFKGKKLSLEHRQKLSAAKLGKKQSQKAIEKKKGKPLEENHKKNISSSLKGRKFSKETNIKRAESLRGRKFSEESKKKMAESQKGKKQSPETIAKRLATIKRKKEELLESVQKMSQESVTII